LVDQFDVMQANLSMLGQERDDLLLEKDTLKNELAAVQTQNDEFEEKINELTHIVKMSDSSGEQLAEIQAENKALKKQLEEILNSPNGDIADTVDTNVQKELMNAINSSEQLQKELVLANRKIKSLESLSGGDILSSDQAEVIASIAQDLRQPMSSISGYTDLLLSESVGILGALQRKFLDRVKASTERMNNLIGDLIQITALDSGAIELSPQPIEFTDIIDDTITQTSPQMREKNIVLRVNLPDELPQMNTDKDAVQQILLHLLQNAGAASPEEGEIYLRAELTSGDNQEEFIQIGVTDTGEGIPEEDMQRVFSRLYRADNPLIQGVGDTGVGLSIAKTLTEALGGTIWVESEINHGSTFNVMLPISSHIPSLNGETAS
jgi:signal transduction histidine kinase